MSAEGATYVVMLGMPGAGKGTQAKSLAAVLGFPHVSSGDLFRENIRQRTELGREAVRYISGDRRGELVPDELTIGMVRRRLEQPDAAEGAILDGFPRTLGQAAALETLAVELGARVGPALHIRLPLERLVERMAGRRVCARGGHVYHLTFNPPKRAGVCDIDGSELVQREDDQPETVRKRVRVYEAETAPLIEFYRSRGALQEINGDQPIAAVTAEMLASVRPEAAR